MSFCGDGILMSGMDAMSMLCRVKGVEPNISVIIMTGYGTDSCACTGWAAVFSLEN